jgi:transmembrane sensor
MEKQNLSNLNIDSLLVKYIIGPASEAERNTVETWLKESKANQNYFNQLKDIYLLGKTTKQPSGFDAGQSLQRIKGNYYQAKYAGEMDNRKILRFRRHLLVAAIFVAAMGLGFLLKSALALKEKPVIHMARIYNVVMAPRGSKSKIILPDGSIVWLNAGSSVKYPMNFLQGDREVFLSGEAFFDVAKVKNKRFIVRASDLAIKVWGTKFNVKAYPEEKTIVTTLVEGSVSIQKIKNTSRVKETYLSPNQTAIFFKETGKEHVIDNNNAALNKVEPKPSMVVKEKVNTILYTSWKDDKWVIEGITLGDLASELERRYNMNIMFENNSIKHYRFNGIITNETLEQLLEVMKISAPIDYTISNNNVLLKENKSSKDKYDQYLTH